MDEGLKVIVVDGRELAGSNRGVGLPTWVAEVFQVDAAPAPEEVAPSEMVVLLAANYCW